jgi:hypothetical protein
VLTGILFFLEMLMEPRASGMLGKCSTVSHAPSPTTFFFFNTCNHSQSWGTASESLKAAFQMSRTVAWTSRKLGRARAGTQRGAVLSGDSLGSWMGTDRLAAPCRAAGLLLPGYVAKWQLLVWSRPLFKALRTSCCLWTSLN